jgi:small GTP-binding protein
LTLRQTLYGPRNVIGRFAWSPDGHQIAAPSLDHKIYVWNLNTAERLELSDHQGPVYSVAWSPDGQYLASASGDKTVKIWDISRRRAIWSYEGHHDPPLTVAYSPDGKYLASGGKDYSLRFWSVLNGREEWQRSGFSQINCVSWSPRRNELRVAVASQSDIKILDFSQREVENIVRTSSSLYVTWGLQDGQNLFSASEDRMVHLWNVYSGMERGRLEGHLDRVNCVSISADGKFIATKGADSRVILWQAHFNHFEAFHTFSEPTSQGFILPAIAFHPLLPTQLATLGERDRCIRIWDIHPLDDRSSVFGTHYYANAKVALVGESGVGKSALADVLSGRDFQPNLSTKGRRVWSLKPERVNIGDGKFETREIFIWDLAGQPGYRLIHPLHLADVDIAIIVIDGSREIKDTFNSVRTWAHALDATARRRRSGTLQKMLIIARTDVANLAVSKEELQALAEEVGIPASHIIETSAQNGRGVSELRNKIHQIINWQQQPKVSSTDLFQSIRAFLIHESRRQNLLSMKELYQRFSESQFARNYNQVVDLPDHFRTCIRLLESQNLIRRFRFGKRVLLRPELLDSYAAAISFAALTQEQGIGTVDLDSVLNGELIMKPDEQLREPIEERLMLIETVRDLIKQEIALRQETPNGTFMVFPTQFTRELREMPLDIDSHEVVLSFEGNVMTIYATLVVRLAHSGMFRAPKMWRNSVVFKAHLGHEFIGRCAIRMEQDREGAAMLHLLFDSSTSPATRALFEEFVRQHIEDRAVVGSTLRRPIFACSKCGEKLSESQVAKRLERGFDFATCPVCDSPIQLVEPSASVIQTSSLLLRMSKLANTTRDQHEHELVVEGRRAANEFDAALLYSDRSEERNIRVIAKQLAYRLVVPWLEINDARTNEHWYHSLHRAMPHMKAVVIFVGERGVSWSDNDVRTAIHEFLRSNRKVVIAVLPGAHTVEQTTIPAFLANTQIVRCDIHTPNPYDQLAEIIAGRRSSPF